MSFDDLLAVAERRRCHPWPELAKYMRQLKECEAEARRMALELDDATAAAVEAGVGDCVTAGEAIRALAAKLPKPAGPDVPLLVDPDDYPLF